MGVDTTILRGVHMGVDRLVIMTGTYCRSLGRLNHTVENKLHVNLKCRETNLLGLISCRKAEL